MNINATKKQDMSYFFPDEIFDLWMQCYTQEEIAEKEEISVQPVKDAISDFSANLPNNLKANAEHAVDFDPPLYNVWKQQTNKRKRAFW